MRWNGIEWCYPGLFRKPLAKRKPRPRTWFRASEVAKVIGVTPATVRQWATSGKLRCERTPTGRMRFAAADIMRWLSRRAAA